jgi:hypothetical protein
MEKPSSLRGVIATKQSSFPRKPLDCFAALAMTRLGSHRRARTFSLVTTGH